MDNQNNDPINTEVDSVDSETDVNNEVSLNTEVKESVPSNFADSLDVEYRNDPNINKFKDINEMAKSYNSLSSMLGKKKAVIPTDKTDAKAMADYFSKVRIPENVDGYKLEPIDLSAVGIESLDFEGFKEAALANNMTQDQANGIAKWYSENVLSTQTQSAEQLQQATSQAGLELRKEFGAAYDEKISKAQNFFKSNFASLSENQELMNKLGNDPKFIKDIANLSSKFSEASIGDVPKTSTLTPAEAGKEKVRLMSTDAYSNQMHPEHKDTVEKYRKLLEQEHYIR